MLKGLSVPPPLARSVAIRRDLLEPLAGTEETVDQAMRGRMVLQAQRVWQAKMVAMVRSAERAGSLVTTALMDPMAVMGQTAPVALTDRPVF